MKKKSSLLTSVLTMFLATFVAQIAAASVLSLHPGDRNIEDVNVAKHAVALIDGRESHLGSVGAGLRAKKVAVVNVNVYVGQLFGSDVSKFVRTNEGALESLSSMNTVAMQMTFLRDVDSTKLQTAFSDAFAANKIDTQLSHIKAFLNAVVAGGPAFKRKTLVVVGEKFADGTEVVTYENASGQMVSLTGPTGFVKDVMSLWMGAPADRGIQDLKNAIIGR